MMFVIVLVSVALANGFLVNPPEESAWANFKNEYKKFYSTTAQDLMRKKVFIQNLREIEAHNAENHSYKQGINKFADLTYEEMEIMTNFGISPPTLNETFKFPTFKFRAPDAMDWRNQNAVTSVKDQGQCGSCWAFSTVGTLESIQFIAGQVSELTRLSEQNLVDCFQKSCKGQFVWEALKYVQSNGGLTKEECYPYDSSDGQSKNCRENRDCFSGQISGHQRVSNENDLKEAIGNVGPVSVQIAVAKTFGRYKTGVYYDPACEDKNVKKGEHAVVAVGYGTCDDGDYWILKNSWGPGFGEKGYIRMRRGVNHCHVGSYAVYPLI